MGTIRGLPAPIEPGPGIGDLVDATDHDIVIRDGWELVLGCRCGVYAVADAERQAWVGPADHVIPFGSGARAFTFAEPDRSLDDPEEGGEPRAVARNRASASSQVMMALGIDAETAG